MDIKKSRGLYAVCSVLAPLSGAAIGALAAILSCVSNMADKAHLTKEEFEDLSNYGWVAEFTSSRARAELCEYLLWGIIAAGIVFAVTFIMLNIMTGNTDRNEDGSIRLNWFDRIWSEVHIAGGIFAATMAIIQAGYIHSIARSLDWFAAYKPVNPNNYELGIPNQSAFIMLFIGMAAMIWAAVACWLSLVKKIKARELLNKSLLGKLIITVWTGIRKAWDTLRAGYRSFSVPEDADQRAAFKLIIKYCLIAAALIWGPIICNTVFFGFSSGFLILPAFISTILAAYIIIRRIGKIAEIRAGVISVKSGDLAHRITVNCDMNGPKTELDKLASDINHISEATDIAVQNEIKNQRLKTDLISNVSHDLKTPLTSMISYLDILEREGLDSPDAEEHLAIVREKTDRLKTLTEELFEAAKASSGNIPCEIEDIDIAALVDQSLAELSDRLSARNLIIRKSIRTEQTMVRADGKLLYRVFENLLSNISKYALEGSRVYIDVNDIPGSERKLIEFKNISKDELNISADELMERFTRGDSSRNTEGSGLGLAIARDLTTLMGGNFDISIDGDMFKASVRI
ncbi:MAG: HAMP domain-containing histidine kinase [Mogibacterium sp.]|nr:HAMP domain-containing histidine kinase [Mogibacterium sp.]